MFTFAFFLFCRNLTFVDAMWATTIYFFSTALFLLPFAVLAEGKNTKCLLTFIEMIGLDIVCYMS